MGSLGPPSGRILCPFADACLALSSWLGFFVDYLTRGGAGYGQLTGLSARKQQPVETSKET